MTSGLHVFCCNSPKRTRHLCPYHLKLEYGELQDFYDTRRIFFDCGAFADYGYGYYEPPQKYKHLKIFWDSELAQYILTASYNMQLLFTHSNYSKILRIAKRRLKPGGIIKIKDNRAE